MKYLLPLTIAAAAAWGARDSSSGGGAALPFAGASTRTVTGVPPWLREGWEAGVQAGADAELHAALHVGAGTGVCPAAEMAPDVTEPMLMEADADPHATAAGRAALLEAGLEPRPVARSSAANGHSIAEIHAQRTSLTEHRVRVRGTVVKRTDGILGKSFLHLWDGSAAPGTGADDLTVTTSEDFRIGETVEIEGRLLIDQDLGVGYRYAALLAEATRAL